MVAPNATSRRPTFHLGQLVATPGALNVLENSGETALPYLARHARGDWGEVDQHDRKANDEAVAYEGDPDRQQRVLSAYRTKSGQKIWIITEWDRSVTTVLLPEEY